MKKIMTIAMAFVLTMGMTVTAFAAGSPVTSVNAGDTVKVGDEEVKAEVKVTTVDETVSNEAAKVAGALTTVDDKTVEATIIGDVVDVKLPKDIVPTFEKPVTITFQVTGVSSDDKIIVAHKKENGEWEYITPTAIANGSVTVPFTSLSPVAFIKVSENVKADTENNSTSDDAEDSSEADSAKSPKTGETSAFYVEFLAAASFCGAAIFFKRSKTTI